MPEPEMVGKCGVGGLRLSLLTSGGCWLGPARRRTPSAVFVEQQPETAIPSLNSLPAPFLSSAAIVDPDGRIYIRNWQGGILSGGFEKNPKPLFTEGRNQLEIQNLQEDWDHFGMLRRKDSHARLQQKAELAAMQAVWER